jgi:fructose-bisphosphate aldolase class II
MPLVKLDEVLNKAKAENYPVGAFDFSSLPMMLGILDAAEETGTPVILAFPDSPRTMGILDILTPAMLAAAKKARVPVVIHLDHGKSVDACKRCVEAGFSSIMIDASGNPYEENARITKEVVAFCKSRGIPVEGEIGHVGRGIDYDLNAYQYTDPEEAKRFVLETGVDALAVAIGNAHGVYKGDPKINYAVLEKLLKEVPVPLVLHGGSGIHDEDFRKMAKLGMSKFNIFTEANMAAAAKLRGIDKESLNADAASEAIRTAFREKVLEKIRLFGTKSM